MNHLLRTIQGGLIRTSSAQSFLVTGCELRATSPPAWSYAVLKARGLEMVLSHPTPYDHQQAFRVVMDPQPDGEVAVLVNQQIVLQGPRLHEFKIQLFGVPCIAASALDPVRTFMYTRCAPMAHETLLRN